MDLNDLKKPTDKPPVTKKTELVEVKQTKPASKKAAPKKKATRRAKKAPETKVEVVTPSSNNLHKPERGKKVTKQFLIPADLSFDFDIAASEAGYNRRQGSDFFEVIFQFYKDNHK